MIAAAAPATIEPMMGKRAEEHDGRDRRRQRHPDHPCAESDRGGIERRHEDLDAGKFLEGVPSRASGEIDACASAVAITSSRHVNAAPMRIPRGTASSAGSLERSRHLALTSSLPDRPSKHPEAARV